MARKKGDKVSSERKQNCSAKGSFKEGSATRRVIGAGVSALLIALAAGMAFCIQAWRVHGEISRHREYLGRSVGIEIMLAFGEGEIQSLNEFQAPEYPYPDDNAYFDYRLEIDGNVSSLGSRGIPFPIAYLLPRKDVPSWYLYRPAETIIVLTSDMATHRVSPGHDLLGFKFSIPGGRLPADVSHRSGAEDDPTGLDIQKLLDQSGGRIDIPRGTYILHKALDVMHDDTTIWCEPGTRILVGDVNENVINIHGVNNFKIENAHLSHLNPLEEYICHGRVIDIKDSGGVSILNCELNGCGAVGVFAENSSKILVRNCWIHHNTFNAIYLHGCEEVSLIANLIEDNANFIQLHYTTGFEASDNMVRNNGGYWREREPDFGMRKTSGQPTP